MPEAQAGPRAKRKPCAHDSTRVDGALDPNCLLCGWPGYWHQGHRHDSIHPSGKVLFTLTCPEHGP